MFVHRTQMLSLVAVLALVAAACGTNADTQPAGGLADAQGPAEQTLKDEPEAASHSFTDGDRISLLIPFGPGGGYDTQARIVTPYLEQELEALTGLRIKVQPLNLPGGGTLVAMGLLNQSTDNRTVLYQGDTGANQQVFMGANLDMASFTAIGTIGVEALGFVRTPALAELEPGNVLGLAERSQQTPILVGHTGNEPLLNIMLQLLKEDGIDLRFDYVVLQGTSDLVGAMLRGDVELGFTSMAGVAPQVAGNDELDFFLPMGCERHRAAPDVLTVTEIAEMPISRDVICSAIGEGWRGLVGPPGMDESDAEIIRQALENAHNNEEMREELLATNFEPGSMSREEWATYFSRLIKTWEELAR